MKLIDILVEELPKRGGWPEGSTRCMQTDGLYVTFPDIGDHCDFVAKCMAEGVRIATREQYEAALAASKSKWDGDGLPPVGCECEARYRYSSVAEWFFFRCVAVDCEVAFGWTGKKPVTLLKDNFEFRPIRSEADKKKEAVIRGLDSAVGYAKASEINVSEHIFSSIAAGKIPHIRID